MTVVLLFPVSVRMWKDSGVIVSCVSMDVKDCVVIDFCVSQGMEGQWLQFPVYDRVCMDCRVILYCGIIQDIENWCYNFLCQAGYRKTGVIVFCIKQGIERLEL